MTSYADFRSGLTFTDVRAELQSEQEAARARGDAMYVTRHTVLGRWGQHKRALWEAYKRAHPGEWRDNPPPSFLEMLAAGASDSAHVLAGKAGVRLASGYLPGLPRAGAAGLASGAAVALAVGVAAAQLLGQDGGRVVLAGAFAGALEKFLAGYSSMVFAGSRWGGVQ